MIELSDKRRGFFRRLPMTSGGIVRSWQGAIRMKVAQFGTLAGFFLACLLAIAGMPAALAWFALAALAAWSVIAVVSGVLILLGVVVG